MMDSVQPPQKTSHVQVLCVLNSIAFGIVCPFLFYVVSLPTAVGIALLLCSDIAGRYLGQRVFPRLVTKLGDRETTLLAQGLVLVSSLGLALACIRPIHIVSLGLVYLWRFGSSAGTALFPTARLLFQDAIQAASRSDEDRWMNQATLIGFAIGCAISSLPMNHHVVDGSILGSGLLRLPSLIALGFSFLGMTTALLWRDRYIYPQRVAMQPQRANQQSVILAEAGFGIILCLLPLMQWESFAFTPARLAMFLGYSAIVSLCVQRFFYDRPDTSHRSRTAGGLLFLTLGFTGVMLCGWLVGANGFREANLGYGLLWLVGTTIALAHGVLNAAFRLNTEAGDTHPSAGAFQNRLPLITGAAALVACSLWASHQRLAFAIPCLLATTALILSIRVKQRA